MKTTIIRWSLLYLFLCHVVYLGAQEIKTDTLRLSPVAPLLDDSLKMLHNPFEKPKPETRSLIEVAVPDIRDMNPLVIPPPPVPIEKEGSVVRRPYWESYNTFTMGVGLTGGTWGMPVIGGVNIISPHIWMNVGERFQLRLGDNLMQFAELSYVNNIVTPWLPVRNNIINQLYISGSYDVTPWFRILADARQTFHGGFPQQFGIFLPPDQSVSVGGAVKLLGNFGVAVKRQFDFYNGKMIPRTTIEPYLFEEKNPRPYVSKKDRALIKVKQAYQ